MTISNVITSIDSEISRLEQARAMLAADGAVTRRGKSSVKSPGKSKSRRKRVLSAEARERIAEAQRKRWAAQKKAAAK